MRTRLILAAALSAALAGPKAGRAQPAPESSSGPRFVPGAESPRPNNDKPQKRPREREGRKHKSKTAGPPAGAVGNKVYPPSRRFAPGGTAPEPGAPLPPEAPPLARPASPTEPDQPPFTQPASPTAPALPSPTLPAPGLGAPAPQRPADPGSGEGRTEP